VTKVGAGLDFAEVRQSAQRMDAEDVLADLRSRFYLPGDGPYMDGNSLGLLSIDAHAALAEALDAWRRYGIDGWLRGAAPWYDLPEQLAARVAELVGARADEVAVTGSTTGNLHQMLATFAPTSPDQAGRRRKILVEGTAFPSDFYAVQSHLQGHGFDPEADLIVVEPEDGLLRVADVCAALSSEVALVVLSSVAYASGQLLPMRRLTEAAHAVGATIGWDLSHSFATVVHTLHDDDIDFAVWCHYKYGCAGPGAAAGLFLHERHGQRRPGMCGWWGSDKGRQFDMSRAFYAAPGAAALALGTPPILAMAPLAGALDVIERAGMERIREKSLALTQLLADLTRRSLCDTWGVRIATPLEPGARGGHLALQHPEAARVCKALKAHGIVPDFRPPDVIRLAPVALYTRFVDVVTLVEVLEQILRDREYERYPSGREVVA